MLRRNHNQFATTTLTMPACDNLWLPPPENSVNVSSICMNTFVLAREADDGTEDDEDERADERESKASVLLLLCF